ncbi:WAS/WASL-interacting protein family member 1-like [Oppia nitens]|uniref:WAS/WASL-interacting protein family member 1-like n=1 Tax=Oppia nitens TaxID=1686743 RepID=UPI0023DA3145|nr:WAS/WASL-interacting protein family member 1-like [Oppia nitens]
MAPLPPPPPPAPPPPPMGGPPVAGQPKLSKNQSTDRNALLSQIRGGAKLKKSVIVNDRSAPAIDDKSKNSNTSGNNVGSAKPINNGLKGGPMGLGGLFAGGVPKLRQTGSKLVANGLTVSANKVNNNLTKTDESVRQTNTLNKITTSSSTSSIKTSLESKFQNNLHLNSNNTNTNSNNNHSINNSINNNNKRISGSNSNLSFLHSNGLNVNNNNSYNNNNNNNKYHTMKAREKPNYLLSEGKGQAPQVPGIATNRPNAPDLPKKPPAIQRSNSQSNSRLAGNVRRPGGPPPMKPPPPPKLSNGVNSVTPLQLSPQQQLITTFPSKPSHINQRKSFTEDENISKRPDISTLVSNFNQQSVKPPAPPRGPTSNGISSSPTYPPPPPPLSTMPNRSNSTVGSTVARPPVKSIAPSVPTHFKPPTSLRPPAGPPPPPPHRTTSNSTSNYPTSPPPPPSQTKISANPIRNGLPSNISGPPPPLRDTSIRNRDEFLSRFPFRGIYEIPAPSPPTISNKVYPSQMQQSQRRRDPPPPPPQVNGAKGTGGPTNWTNTSAHNNNNIKKLPSNPMLHIGSNGGHS